MIAKRLISSPFDFLTKGSALRLRWVRGYPLAIQHAVI